MEPEQPPHRAPVSGGTANMKQRILTSATLATVVTLVTVLGANGKFW